MKATGPAARFASEYASDQALLSDPLRETHPEVGMSSFTADVADVAESFAMTTSTSELVEASSEAVILSCDDDELGL